MARPSRLHLGSLVASTVTAALVAAALSLPAGACRAEDAQGGAVLTYHGSADRSGNFVVPALTWDKARALHLDEDFHAQVSGHVYAQPLFWRPSGGGAAMLIVATEDDVVHALDAHSGKEIWKRSLGRPAPAAALSCGNISPVGITGTPVIDPASEAVYLDAAVDGPSGPRHLVFGLALKDGAPLAGWPVDVAEALARQHRDFTARDQGERGALAILSGTLFVPYGGYFGDCGGYHGTVVGITLAAPHTVASFATRARGGGIWAPGGISSDGASLFVATGNTFGASTWSDGEAVLRLAPDLHRPDDKRDFFAPSDWHALDARDADLGGTNPLPLDVPGPNGKQALLLALGKDRKAYLLDRNNLGGIGGSLVEDTVAMGAIITAPAAYPADDGMFVAFHAAGAHCPASGASGLTVLKITPGTPPKIATAWCAAVRGAGSVMVTTTDGRQNPIVWMLGAEGDDRLHGFRGDSGEPLFSGPSQALAGLRHFQTLIAAPDRLYVAADGRVYAFAF